VIARNSTSTYKGRAVEIRQVGRDLGVRYVLEGSVRRSGDRVRITGQLLEAETGTCLWADRFDGRLEDVFDLQDDIASSIVGCIEPRMRTAEVRRAVRQTTSLQAYDHFLRALAAFDRLTRASLEVTLVECQQAVALDPAYASAYGLAAWCYIWRDAQAWTADSAGERAESIRHARLAIEFGADDPTALWMAGHVIAYSGAGNEEGARIIDRSLAINPNSAQAWNVNGWVHAYLGHGTAAVGHFERAMRLSPLDPLGHTFKCGLAFACLADRDYTNARRWADLALADQPKFVPSLRVKAAACGLLGRTSEARATVRTLLAAVPHYTLADVPDRSGRKAPHYLAYVEGLRKAGVPEK
jgi:adenylate cyclase